MPYPLPSDDEVRDLLEPRERLLFDMMERQMQLSRLHLQAYNRAVAWGVICSFCLCVVAVALLVELVNR